MTSKEALDNITNWIEYFTRLDYVEPIVRDEVQKNFFDAYHKTRPELELIKKDLEVLDIFVKGFKHMTSWGEILVSNEEEETIRRWLNERES